jgi:hypothetical protein
MPRGCARACVVAGGEHAAHGHGSLDGFRDASLWMFAGMAGFLLITGCKSFPPRITEAYLYYIVTLLALFFHFFLLFYFEWLLFNFLIFFNQLCLKAFFIVFRRLYSFNFDLVQLFKLRHVKNNEIDVFFIA